MPNEDYDPSTQNCQLEPSPSNLPAPIVNRPIVLAPGTRTIDTPIHQCPTNLDLSRADHRAWAFNAGNPADIKLEGAKPLRIDVVAYLILPDRCIDPETGEIREFERLILFNKEGECFKTSSAFGWHRAKAAIELFSRSEWERGIPFLIQARQGEQKRWYHDIRVVFDMEDAAGPPE